MKLTKTQNGSIPALHRSLTLELVRVTERAAIAAISRLNDDFYGGTDDISDTNALTLS